LNWDWLTGLLVSKFQLKAFPANLQWTFFFLCRRNLILEKPNSLFSLSLTNVLDRLELADLYQTKSLNSACGQLIQSNLKVVKQDAKWLELKKKSPELAFAILEDVDEFGNGNVNIHNWKYENTQKNANRE
jgi:hypothetical protein